MKQSLAAFAAIIVLGTAFPASSDHLHEALTRPSPPIGRIYATDDRVATTRPPLRMPHLDPAESDGGGVKRTQVVYFVPRDQPNEGLHQDGTLATSAESMVRWFARETGTERTGSPARRPRMVRTGTGTIDVVFVRGEQDRAEYTSLGVIAEELEERGYADADTRYLIYAAVRRGNICGEGYYGVPGVFSGRYAAVYLDSAEACGSRDFGGGTAASAGRAETIAAHEWLHNEGVVEPFSPRHCAASWFHICTAGLYLADVELDDERRDIMFPLVYAPLRNKILDRDLDDYLDHPWPHVRNLRDSAWLE